MNMMTTSGNIKAAAERIVIVLLAMLIRCRGDPGRVLVDMTGGRQM